MRRTCVFTVTTQLRRVDASGALSTVAVRTGVVLLVLSALGSATLVAGALFPLLALSTLGFEVWVGAVAWHWLRR